MKYKRQFATGALALSLLVGGSSVYAATPQDLGIKNTQANYQRQNRNKERDNSKVKKQNNLVGVVSAINSNGFILDIKNLKLKTVSSIDVKTDVSTVYKKDGISATVADIIIGQKLIVSGSLDKTTNILTAKTVKIVTKVASNHGLKNGLGKGKSS
jgi:hypothetical protein